MASAEEDRLRKFRVLKRVVALAMMLPVLLSSAAPAGAGGDDAHTELQRLVSASMATGDAILPGPSVHSTAALPAVTTAAAAVAALVPQSGTPDFRTPYGQHVDVPPAHEAGAFAIAGSSAHADADRVRSHHLSLRTPAAWQNPPPSARS